MKRILFLIMMVSTILSTGLPAQDTQQVIDQKKDTLKFSLEEARKYAMEHNYDILNAMTDIEMARKKVTETMAIGLPQINGAIDYNDFIDIPTQLIPGEFFGEPAGTFIPVKFGTKYNMGLSLTANQLIFSGEYIIGLQAMTALVDNSKMQYSKKIIELDKSVAQSYYLVLIALRNQKIVDSTLVSLREIRNANVALYENGFIEDTDVDQINLLISDLEATQLDIEKNLEVSYNFLKFQMGLKLENTIVLTDDLDQLLEQIDEEILVAAPFDYKKNIDYKILQNQQQLAYLDLRRYKSLYLPNVSAFLNYSENAQRNEWNFLESGQEWYRTTILGISMNVPIFSSGDRAAKVSQAKLKIEKVRVADEMLKSGLEIQISTARNTFTNSWKAYQNKKKGLDLSYKIYLKAREKLFEGVASTTELQQLYNQYLDSEREYVLAILGVLQAKLNLEALLAETEY